MTDKEENLTEKEQIKILEHYISELYKYAEETAAILGLNTSATILVKGCIEYWAVLSSASNNAIKKLQQENEELKQFQEDAKKVLKTLLDNFDKMENHYRNAINEIEKYIKKYEPTRDDEFALIEYEHLRDILVIINKIKREQNDR